MTKFVMKEKGLVYATEDGKFYIEKTVDNYWAVTIVTPYKSTTRCCYFSSLKEAKEYVDYAQSLGRN